MEFLIGERVIRLDPFYYSYVYAEETDLCGVTSMEVQQQAFTDTVQFIFGAAFYQQFCVALDFEKGALALGYAIR
jgi:hypothetical protein